MARCVEDGFFLVVVVGCVEGDVPPFGDGEWEIGSGNEIAVFGEVLEGNGNHLRVVAVDFCYLHDAIVAERVVGIEGIFVSQGEVEADAVAVSRLEVGVAHRRCVGGEDSAIGVECPERRALNVAVVGCRHRITALVVEHIHCACAREEVEIVLGREDSLAVAACVFGTASGFEVPSSAVQCACRIGGIDILAIGYIKGVVFINYPLVVFLVCEILVAVHVVESVSHTGLHFPATVECLVEVGGEG